MAAEADGNIMEEMAGLTMEGGAEGGLTFAEGLLRYDPVDPSLCLVGQFLTSKVINFDAMQNSLAALW